MNDKPGNSVLSNYAGIVFFLAVAVIVMVLFPPTRASGAVTYNFISESDNPIDYGRLVLQIGAAVLVAIIWGVLTGPDKPPSGPASKQG